MADVLLIGASGKVAKQTLPQLLEAGFSVKALVRDARKLSEFTHDNLKVHEQDLESDFSDAFRGCDKVVFSAGSGAKTGADKTLMIDLWAARNAVEFAKANSVERFVMVSAVGADDPDQDHSALKPYLVAKHMADEHLIKSGLTYTILRPGALTDDAGTRKVRTSMPANKDDAKIPRQDVGTAVLHALKASSEKSQIVTLFSGETEIETLF